MNLKIEINNLNSESWNIGLTEREKSYELAQEALNLSLESSYKRGEAESLLNLGWIYLWRSKYLISLGLFKKARLLFQELDDLKSVTKAIAGISAANYYSGNYHRSIDANIENIILSEKSGDTSRKMTAYTNSSAVYVKLSRGERALELAQKALDLSTGIELSDEQKSIIYKNLGDSYLVLNRLDEAFHYVNLSYDSSKRIGYKEGIFESLCSLGKIYHKRDELEMAEETFNKVYSLCISNLNGEEIILEIARFYYHVGDIRKSQFYLKEAIVMALKNSMFHTIISANELFVKIANTLDESTGSYLKKIKEYIDIADMNVQYEREYLIENYNIVLNI